MAEVEFIYNGLRTIIQCNLKEKMKDISKRFKDKMNINKQNIYYSYNGKIGINEELIFEEVANIEDKRRKKMNILVFDNMIETKNKEIIKSKNIICPECKESIRMNINEYKINLFKCKNGHNIDNILLDHFEETQNINIAHISCDICKKINKSLSYDNIFYKCLTCNNNICPLCKSNHDKNHSIINYDEKYYICNEHNEKYISYCDDCDKNLCILCDEHKHHKRILFSDILPKKEELIEKKNRLKNSINKFNNEIKKLMNILNEVMNKINMLYKIYEDLINNYDNKNRNYEIIYNINKISYNEIINELNKISECDIKEKYNNIYNIYRKMEIDEINIIYNIKDLNIVQLFGEDFVRRYKNTNLKLIIEGKEQDLINEKYTNLLINKKETLQIKLKGINNITDASYMFNNCKSLISLPDISKWNTSNIINMSNMFAGCVSLISLPDISKWNTYNIDNMSCMFSSCISLISLPDISKWNTFNVKNMDDMFMECNSLLSLPDISNWNISNINDINGIFYDCNKLICLPDISKWNTSKVNNMSYMFYCCNSLSSLPDISKWNTSNVNKMNYMFYGCNSLSSLPDISLWDISNVNNMNYMFNGCKDSLNIPNKFKVSNKKTKKYKKLN